MSRFERFRRAVGDLSLELPAVAVLAYHRVAPPDGPDPWNLRVSPEHFKEHLEVVRDYPCLALDQLGDPPHRAVAITFDDGYADNLEFAAPLLDGLPATFFVVSGDHEAPFWWDELASRGGLHLYEQLLDLDPEARRRALDRLPELQGVCPPRLKEEQLRRLSRFPRVEVGGHSVSHPRLSRLPAEEALREMAECRARLEEVVGRPVTSFSYPHGAAPSRDLVRRAGYLRGCTVTPDRVWRNSDPLRLPRFTVQDWPQDEFAGRLAEWLR